MKMNFTVLSVLTLVLICAFYSEITVEGVKPGVCPPSRGIGLCVEFCFDDSECPLQEKCCSNGCGHSCSAPVTEITVEGLKPGVCPPSRGIGLCVEFCSEDSECPLQEKCCSNGCGHQCSAPYTEKPGLCPHQSWHLQRCVGVCSVDYDCPNNDKCCTTGCGRQCISPYKEKPGLCPVSLVQRCSRPCVDDSDCTNYQKCCSTGCGHVCLQPF